MARLKDDIQFEKATVSFFNGIIALLNIFLMILDLIDKKEPTQYSGPVDDHFYTDERKLDLYNRNNSTKQIDDDLSDTDLML